MVHIHKSEASSRSCDTIIDNILLPQPSNSLRYDAMQDWCPRSGMWPREIPIPCSTFCLPPVHTAPLTTPLQNPPNSLESHFAPWRRERIGRHPWWLGKCVEYLEMEGLEVTGIFHRVPSNVKVCVIKRRFDLGEWARWSHCSVTGKRVEMKLRIGST